MMKTLMRRILALFVPVATSLAARISIVAVPLTALYQGFLTDESAMPVDTGSATTAMISFL